MRFNPRNKFNPSPVVTWWDLKDYLARLHDAGYGSFDQLSDFCEKYGLDLSSVVAAIQIKFGADVDNDDALWDSLDEYGNSIGDGFWKQPILDD